MKLSDFLVPFPPDRRMTVAVALANDPEIVRGIAGAMNRGLAHFVLIGDPDATREAAEVARVDISRARLETETDGVRACALAAELVKAKEAQVLMKGIVSTAIFTRMLLDKENDFVVPGDLISHVGVFDIPAYHKPVIITDAGINISPPLEDKVKILQNAIDFARMLGIPRPKAACIAPLEKVNPRIPSTGDAEALSRMAAEGRFGDAFVAGPLALDVAVLTAAAATKGIESAVVGDPDILLLADLDTANVFYKSLTLFGGARAASVAAGVRVPVVITSRSDDEETRLISIGLGVRLASAALAGNRADG